MVEQLGHPYRAGAGVGGHEFDAGRIGVGEQDPSTLSRWLRLPA
jgi:hypothetical protein